MIGPIYLTRVRLSDVIDARALALVTDPERAAQAGVLARQRAWQRLRDRRDRLAAERATIAAPDHGGAA